ncbi:hypothetical protein FF38_05295 [Lucilia cuprina]|uniref:Uncharacterized protein n=1 Tax=Lucilia cuprina TaxID=7375 RepID=A0A0L0CKX0_LUCCU|nr:hypothetical protein FF38_05295 [Lucilia cuprina]
MLFYQIQIIFQILVLILQVKYSKSLLYGRCSTLNNKLLTRLCIAQYPREIKLRYLDDHVIPNLNYAVFRVNDQNNHYFITHDLSDIHNCTNNLKILEADFLQCDQSVIKLKSARMVCLKHRTYVADELIDYCLGSWGTITKFVAMHYNEPSKLLKQASNKGKQLKDKLKFKFYLLHILWLLKSFLLHLINK